MQTLSPKKEWIIGPGLRVGVAHLESVVNEDGRKRFNGKDLDPHNKQHWVGVLKLFHEDSVAALQKRIFDGEGEGEGEGGEGETHLKATHAICLIFSKYLSMWLGDREPGRTPLMAVEEAGMVLAFLYHWRHYVVTTPGLTTEANFLTRETFLDMVTSCHHCILRFPQFRDNWGGKFKPDGPRFSSAYSEYFHQYGRMAQCNSPVVSVRGWVQHLKHYIYQQHLEATSSLRLPASCRGIPHSIERVQIPVFDASWHPTDAELIAAVDRGMHGAINLLQQCGITSNLTVRSGFFKQPCKHFPLKDTYVTLMHGAVDADEAAGKEDDPNGDGGGEEPPSKMDAEDAADALALMNQLMRSNAGGGADDSHAAFRLVVDEISSLITAFNQSLQEESKDRKYRFVTKRLMKAHQRAGDTLDDELDFYRDDDDVAVLFSDVAGKKVWVIGNIEEVAVVRGTVEQQRAVGGASKDYLLKLDKDYRPAGVYVDDPKGAFIFRWYREVDGAGSLLEGYQNKECKAYKLTLDNDKEPYYWTSNLQLVSKVYMRKHPSQPRTHSINANDKKMVSAKVNALS